MWTLFNHGLLLTGPAAQRLMRRTGRGRLRPLWQLVYAVGLQIVVAILRPASEAVYVRGSFAGGEPIYGLSDVDLVAVVRSHSPTGVASDRSLRDRTRQFYAKVPAARSVVDLNVYSHADLKQAFLSPFQTYPLDRETLEPLLRARFYGANYHGLGPRPEAGFRLHGRRSAWRSMAGGDPIAQLAASPDAYRWLWGWLDLQFFWKHTFRICANPSSPQATYFCVKTILEPTRMWMWLAHGIPPAKHNSQTLDQALRVIPEEEPTLRLALRLRQSLPANVDPPIREALSYLSRISDRVADRVAEESARTGSTSVTLIGGPTDSYGRKPGDDAFATGVYPLVDWRTLVLGDAPSSWFELFAGDPADPALLGALAQRTEGPWPALRSRNLLVLPTARSGVRPLGAAAFRAVECPVSDPIPFALLDGSRTAEFPNLPGWNAPECAIRAVLEHRAWLASEDSHTASAQRRLVMLFSAARAALFHESIVAGDPQVQLTEAAVAAALAQRDLPAAEAAYEHHQASHTGKSQPPVAAVAQFERDVRSLLGKTDVT